MRADVQADAVRAIEALIFAYAEHIDGGNFDALAELFADASLRSDGRPAVRRGRDEVRQLYRDLVILYDGTPRTKHVTTNVVITIDDAETAAARSYYTVLQQPPQLPLQVIVAGRYHDRFVRRAAHWQFSDRLIFVDLIGDLRHHLRRAV